VAAAKRKIEKVDDTIENYENREYKSLKNNPRPIANPHFERREKENWK